ncbi:MAG TPA: DUF4446 family protein [Candidatus Eremiobacteraceae bacterium]|nr:DUF4446 family protein [Candidatus Eremiobacteraceae bacterium]
MSGTKGQVYFGANLGHTIVMTDGWQAFVSGLAPAATSATFVLSAIFTIAALVVYHVTTARSRSGGASSRQGTLPVATPPDLSDVRRRLAALEAATDGSLQNVGFVRFNAFPDVGSELSYALAVVDGKGDGFVVSSIYSREEVRTYAKAVSGYETDKETSEEERKALGIAKERSGRPRQRG